MSVCLCLTSALLSSIKIEPLHNVCGKVVTISMVRLIVRNARKSYIERIHLRGDDHNSADLAVIDEGPSRGDAR